jgi:hypothetical protein
MKTSMRPVPCSLRPQKGWYERPAWYESHERNLQTVDVAVTVLCVIINAPAFRRQGAAESAVEIQACKSMQNGL